MGDVVISLSDGVLKVEVNEYLEPTDIQKMLSFDPENLEQLLCEHASVQAYWEALATRLLRRYEDFKDNWSRKWWAWHRTYARHVLAAYGDTKPAVGSVDDMVISMYSSDTALYEREKYLKVGYIYAVKKNYSGTEADYIAESRKYLEAETPWYFESVAATTAQLKEDWSHVERVAKRLESKAYKLDTYVKLQMRKFGNVGPQSYSGSTDRAVQESLTRDSVKRRT